MALNKKITAMVLSTLISTSVFAQSADPCVKLELAQEKAHSELLKVERESKELGRAADNLKRASLKAGGGAVISAMVAGLIRTEYSMKEKMALNMAADNASAIKAINKKSLAIVGVAAVAGGVIVAASDVIPYLNKVIELKTQKDKLIISIMAAQEKIEAHLDKNECYK